MQLNEGYFRKMAKLPRFPTIFIGPVPTQGEEADSVENYFDKIVFLDENINTESLVKDAEKAVALDFPIEGPLGKGHRARIRLAWDHALKASLSGKKMLLCAGSTDKPFIQQSIVATLAMSSHSNCSVEEAYTLLHKVIPKADMPKHYMETARLLRAKGLKKEEPVVPVENKERLI